MLAYSMRLGGGVMNKLIDPSAEMAVLSAMFNIGYDSYIQYADILSNEVFQVDNNQLLYTLLKYLFEQRNIHRPDLASLNSAAQALSIFHILNTKDCTSHIKKVISFHVNPDNVGELAARLRRLEIARRMRSKLLDAVTELDTKVTGDERLSDIMGIGERAILDMDRAGDSNKIELIGSDILEYIQEKKNNPGTIPGLSTGYTTYDEAIGGGMRFGSTNYVGARIKGYKSAFSLNVAAYNSVSQQLPVLYLDTELDKHEEQVPRLLSMLSGISIKKVERGLFANNEFDEKRIFEWGNKIHSECPLYHVNISQIRFTEHLSVARKWIHSVVGVNNQGIANPCLIIYDYMKLVDPADMKNLAEYQAIGFLATNLHNFAVRYKVPILVTCQLNRDGVDKENSTVVSQSDRILWFCSNFSILKQKSIEEIGICPEGTHKLMPIVVRHGPGTKFKEYINLDINGDTFKIKDLGLSTHQAGLINDAEHRENIIEIANQAAREPDEVLRDMPDTQG